MFVQRLWTQVDPSTSDIQENRSPVFVIQSHSLIPLLSTEKALAMVAQIPTRTTLITPTTFVPGRSLRNDLHRQTRHHFMQLFPCSCSTAPPLRQGSACFTARTGPGLQWSSSWTHRPASTLGRSSPSAPERCVKARLEGRVEGDCRKRSRKGVSRLRSSKVEKSLEVMN